MKEGKIKERMAVEFNKNYMYQQVAEAWVKFYRTN